MKRALRIVSAVGLGFFMVGVGAVFDSRAAAQECNYEGTSTCASGVACGDASTCPGQVDCVSNCFVGVKPSASECYLNLFGVRPNHPDE